MDISPFQYIISNKKIDFPINHGEIFFHHNLNIVIHSSNRENLILHHDIIFFGECFDYENASFTNKDIIEKLEGLSLEEKIEKVNKLTGFFIFLFFENNNMYVFNDASGQLETYISHFDDQLYISAQPNFINDLSGNNQYHEDVPQYIIDKKINIFHKTPFKYISKLISNFYYDVANKKYIRFYPVSSLPLINNHTVAEKALHILENSIKSMSLRRRISVAVTAGWDSRILFAASVKNVKNIDYFVLNHNTEDGRQDVKIAQQITDHFSKELKVIDYNLSSVNGIDNNKSTVWKDDEKARKMSGLMNLHFPDQYLINGNISEVARNFYDPLPKNISVSNICYILGIKDGSYEKNAVNEWLKTTNNHIHLLDSIYWEHKMPNWAGSSKSISNMYNIVISPFNNRYLLNLLLSTKRKDRDKYFHKIYENILKIVDENLAKIPLNPTKKHAQISRMKKLHIYPIYRYFFFKLRKLKF
ncbi:hypothetical protein J3D55_001685 [Chryseobacterium ginsenosidimutans]|uniref:hypothetical protein n=1 Tax=Chryseobacterium ginsenosidimutans TaxID=687846 RepID=UPI002169EE73|nr:hypothetical protein [Chryseobacterium ginsenosidimutans]MCS3868769.1 hypothetical protein [Chryseobacterium ginsenosidimutans]